MAEEETIVSVRDNPFFKNDGRRLFRRQPVGAGEAREKTLGLPCSVSHPSAPAHHAIHSFHSLERANKVVHSATHQSSLSLSPIRVTSGSQHVAPVRVPAGSRREAPPATRMETVHSSMRSDGEEDERSEETASVGSGSDLEYGPGIVERLKAKFASLGGKRGEKKQRSPSMSDLAEERNYSTLDRHASAARQQMEHSTQSLTRRHSRSQGDLRPGESRPFTIHRELLSPTAGEEEADMDSLRRRFEAAEGGAEGVKMRRRSPSSDRTLHRLSLLPNDASPPRQLRLAVKSMDMDTPTHATPTSILKKDRDEVEEYRPQPSSGNDDRFVDIAGSGELKVYPVRRSIALEQQRREREEKPGKILDVLNQSSDDSVSLFDSSIRSTMSAGGEVHVPGGGGAAGSEPEFVRQLRRLRRSSECEAGEEGTRVALRRRALDLPSLSDRARVVRAAEQHNDRARCVERSVSPSTPSLPATPAPVEQKREQERKEREAVQRVQSESRQRPEQLFASPPDPHSARERHSPPLLWRESIASDASPPPEEPKPSREKRDKALEPAPAAALSAAPAVSAPAAPVVINRVEAVPSPSPPVSSRLDVPKLRPTRMISPQPPVVPTNDASGMTEMQRLLSRFNKTKMEKYGTEDAPKQDHEVTGRVVEIEKASIPQLQLHHVPLYREEETPSAQAPSVAKQAPEAPAQAPAPAPCAAPHPEEPPRDYSRESSRRSSVSSVCEYDVNPDEQEITPSIISQLPSSLSALSSRPSMDALSTFAPSVVSVRSETTPSSCLAAPRPNVVSISVSAQGNTPSVIYTNHTAYDEPSIRAEIPKRPAPPPPALEESTPLIHTPPPPPPHGRQQAKTAESPRKSLTAMFLEQQKTEEKPYGDDATEIRDNAAEQKEVEEEQKVVTTVVEMNVDVVVVEEDAQKSEEVVDVRYKDDECIYDVVAPSEVGVDVGVVLDSEPEVIEEEKVAVEAKEEEKKEEIAEVVEEEQTVEMQPEVVNIEPTTSQDVPEEKEQDQEEATPLEAPPTPATVEEEYKSIFDDSDEDSDVATSDEEETLLRPSLHGMSSGLLAGDGNPVAVRHSLISLVAEEDLPALMEAMSETYHPVFEDVDDEQVASTSSIIHPPAERRERRKRRKVSSIRFGTSLPTVYTYLDEPSACQETEWRDGVHVEYEVYEKMVAAEDEEYQRKQVELEQWRAQMAAQAAANRLQQQQPEQLKESEFSMGVTQKFTYDAANSISVP